MLIDLLFDKIRKYLQNAFGSFMETAVKYY